MDKRFILVTGAFSSGQAEFIQAVSDMEVVSWLMESRRYDFTAGMYCGRVTLDEETALFFLGTPSARRMDVAACRDALGQDFGIVMIVDSARPDTFSEAHLILHQQLIPSKMPFVVAIDSQHKPDSAASDGIPTQLKIPDDVLVLPCIATQRDSVKAVLLALLKRMPQDAITQKAIAKVTVL